MRAVVLHEYGGLEKLKFEDNVPLAADWRTYSADRGTCCERQPNRLESTLRARGARRKAMNTMHGF